MKLVTGNPGHRPLNEQEAKPRMVIPDPPEMLKRRGAGGVAPRHAAAGRGGLIAKLDRAIIAGYCMAWARWIECEQQLVTTGLIVQGAERLSRCIRRISRSSNKALDQVRQFSEQIGLSGSSRSRIKAGDAPDDDEDPAEDFLRGRA